MAKVGYSYIRIEDSLNQDETKVEGHLKDTELAEWLKSLGIPSNHITKDTTQVYFSESLSPHYRFLGMTESLILQCLVESKIRWHVSSNNRHLRKEKLATASYLNMARRLKRRFAIVEDAVMNVVLNDHQSLLQLAGQVWSIYLEFISEILEPPSPGS